MDSCRVCGSGLRVRKSRTVTVTSLDIGIFRAHEIIRFCPTCGTNYGSEELRSVKPSRSRFGYDVLVYVGRAMFGECRNEEDIQHHLKLKRIGISRREISYLAQKFVIYLSIAHRQSQREVKKLLGRNGGYILHLDATCEGDSPHLMCGLDEITEIVLENTKLSSERVETIVPFLQEIKALYGSPISTVHDMGKGICTAVHQVFPRTPDFICHYHFLADIGKDLLGADNQRMRSRLRKHGIQGTLRKRARQWSQSAWENPTLVQALLDCVQKGHLPSCTDGLLPTLTAYTLVLWALAAKTDGDGYGFPFDRPSLSFYDRLLLLHSILTRLNDERRTHRGKDNKPYRTVLRDLLEVRDDASLRSTATAMREKAAVFDKLRDAMRLALPGGKNGLNDRGSRESMRSIERRVKVFYHSLCSDPALRGKDIYRKMREQLHQYWEKLFCDPIVVQTPKGRRTIHPQRTNNLMEQFFRFFKRMFRRKSGTRPLARTMRAMIADTPLVRNLGNPAYVKILLNGKRSLEERFAQIDEQLVRKEFQTVLTTSDRVPAKVKELIKLPSLPEKLVALCAV